MQYDRFLDGKERFVARSNQEMAGRTLCSWKCHSSKPKDSLIIIKTHMAAAVLPWWRSSVGIKEPNTKYLDQGKKLSITCLDQGRLDELLKDE